MFIRRPNGDRTDPVRQEKKGGQLFMVGVEVEQVVKAEQVLYETGGTVEIGAT